MLSWQSILGDSIVEYWHVPLMMMINVVVALQDLFELIPFLPTHYLDESTIIVGSYGLMHSVVGMKNERDAGYE